MTQKNNTKDIGAAIIIRDKKVLLVHNIKHGIRVEPPGGKKHTNENIKDCIEREVKEELDCDIIVGEHISSYTDKTPEGTFTIHHYFAKIKNYAQNSTQESFTLPEKHIIATYEWADLKRLKALKENGTLVPSMQSTLPNIKKLLT